MVFQFGTVEITVAVEKIQDDINAVGTWLERRERKHEDILISNKCYIEDITNWLGLGKDYP